MKKQIVIVVGGMLFAGSIHAADLGIEMSVASQPSLPGDTVRFICEGTESSESTLEKARITIKDPAGEILVRNQRMEIDGLMASYQYVLSADATPGDWSYRCRLSDGVQIARETTRFVVNSPSTDDGGDVTGAGDTGGGDAATAHQSIQSYDGPATCIECHEADAHDMLESLHMQWSGPTPELTNTNGENLGKAVAGINTFCSYAMSSKGACFSCHVRADGNAPHAPDVNDVDCLMCHSDTYQRKFVADPDNTETVTNILGEEKKYVFGKVDAEGNYTTVPDFEKMPAGTTMVELARTVHKPTRKSCLRCHAKAGGGDWTKRGDMGLSSANPTVDEDFHMSPQGANLSCTACHAASGHKIGGRGIDLRQTEAPAPSCQDCHGVVPHTDSTLNRHANGQISCQVCHIREFAKGGATEMSRDWYKPTWNQAFCSGQGGFVGEEIKESFVTPEYVWFDGTSYVYNVGETIEPDERGVYPMAKANGTAFDGKSIIVPIKRHFTVMPLHESGQMVPPSIMWMFMTGDFDVAVQKGMEDFGMTGDYSIVEADAEMLITHGVDPIEKAPSCNECHDNSGQTPDGSGMVPFDKLGYHTWPAKVKSCTLCHEKKDMEWEALHQKHATVGGGLSCASCHTSEPVGLVKTEADLCNDCHERKSWQGESHKKHLEKKVECATCHMF